MKQHEKYNVYALKTLKIFGISKQYKLKGLVKLNKEI